MDNTHQNMSYGPNQQVADTYSPPEDETEFSHLNQVNEEVETEDDGIPKKKARKGVPLSKRISQLTYQNKLLQDQLQQQHHYQQQHQMELQQKLQETEKRLAQQEDAQIKSLQSSINSNEEVILDQIRRAKEINDTEEELKWQREHASLQDTKARLYAEKAVKEHLRRDEDGFETVSHPLPQSPQYNMQYNAPPTPNNPYLDEWLESTPWANQHDENFSPDLVNEAVEISSQMDKVLRLNGQAEVIGTREYFKTINNIIHERYGVHKEEEEETSSQNNYNPSPQPSRQNNSYVGGVARQGGSMSDRYNNPNPQRQGNVRLTPEQEMLARNLQIRAPGGGFLPPHLARERFVKHLASPSAADLSKPGGTPDRLTIDYGT